MSQTNQLQPSPTDPVAVGPAPHPLAGHLPVLGAGLDQAQANLAQTTKAMKMAGEIKTGLDSLTKLGDTVQPEDVIKEAGTLVGLGHEPMQLAGLLADMPTSGGPALAAWLQQHSATLAANLSQINQAHAVAKHQLGVSGIHNLMAHSLTPTAGAVSPGSPAPGPNLLTMPPAGNA